jgi:hypothetical protein
MITPPASPPRTTVFVTHAAPDDNEFALWLSSKLAIAGYRVWIDRRRLRGGDDAWDQIESALRNESIKQIVVFTRHIKKPGVKKELAIGDVMRRKLNDPAFIVPIRNDDIAYADAPPEFLRGHIINGHPNWHDCFKELLETLEEARVPKSPSPDADSLRRIVEAREDGRRFVVRRSETALTNWFEIKPPPRIRYYRFEGLQDQINAWVKGCTIPTVTMGRLVGAFADPAAFSAASTFEQQTPTAYDIAFDEFIGARNLGPYLDRSSATNDVVNLLRQHFDAIARNRGLLPIEFASKEVGWFFPDGILPENKIVFDAPDGRRVRRAMSGKFKGLRWHVCLLAKPRIWPELVYRIHANVVLSADGKIPLPGERTHKRRRRLTKSWWNDVWRDRLVAAMHFLADENPAIVAVAGNDSFQISTWPLLLEIPVSYDAVDPPLPTEEDEEGNIIPSAALEDEFEDLDQPELEDNGEDDE